MPRQTFACTGRNLTKRLVAPAARPGRPYRTSVVVCGTKGGDCRTGVAAIGSVQGPIQHLGMMRMDTIERDQTEPETTENTEPTEASPFEQIGPRHGMKVHRYYGCTKCVLEEVRGHEKRIGESFRCEVPVPADSIDPAHEQAA
jgi:hypothetical protein